MVAEDGGDGGHAGDHEADVHFYDAVEGMEKWLVIFCLPF